MTLRLSAAMQSLLRQAPEEWRRVPVSPSADALRARGLVEFRTTPGERGTMAGFQWRITETGKVVDGRICVCHRLPPADFHA